MRNSLFAVAVAVLAAGCGDSNNGTGGTGGSGGMVMTPPLSKQVTMNGMKMEVPADYSCNGHRTDPAGATADFTITKGRVVDFQSKNPVPNAVVSVYPDLASLLANQPSSTATCDSSGSFNNLVIPANHYRVNFKITAQPDQIDTYEVGIPVDPTTTMTCLANSAQTSCMDRNSVSTFTANALPGLVGIDYDNTKSVIAGGVRDCAGDFVKGALISINAGGPFMDSNVFYFSDQDLPVRKTLQQFTNFDGLFTAINVPPGAMMATITANGVVGSGNSQAVGSASIPLFAGALTISDVPPLSQ